MSKNRSQLQLIPNTEYLHDGPVESPFIDLLSSMGFSVEKLRQCRMYFNGYEGESCNCVYYRPIGCSVRYLCPTCQKSYALLTDILVLVTNKHRKGRPETKNGLNILTIPSCVIQRHPIRDRVHPLLWCELRCFGSSKFIHSFLVKRPLDIVSLRCHPFSLLRRADRRLTSFHRQAIRFFLVLTSSFLGKGAYLRSKSGGAMM